MELKIAKSRSLPADVLTQTTAILGLRESGKTNTAGVFVEEALDVGQPVVIIDPTDVWWGLQSSADGKKKGYPVIILGGEHGQLPLAEGDGRTIAQFLVEHQASTVLAIRHLRKNAQRRFVQDLAEELYFLKGKAEYKSPLTVVIDEAPLFIPQSVTNDMAGVVGSIEDLVARGRSAGFGVVLISQRAATLNKNVLSQADTIVTHRLTSPHDKKALKEWIEDNVSVENMSEVLTAVAKLKAGEAWLWSPRLDVFERIQMRLKRTFDSSATPKMGKQIVKPTKVAEVDLATLQTKLAAAIEKAKEDDPKLLKQKIKELERALAAAGKSKEHAAAVAALQQQVQALQGCIANMRKRAMELANLEDMPATTIELTLPERRNPTPNHPAPRLPAPAAHVPAVAKKTPPPRTADDSELSKPSRECLKVFYWLREQKVDRTLLAFYSGYSPTSGGVTEALADLRERQLISGWQITAAGETAIAAIAGERPDGPQRREWIRPRLTACGNKILDILIENYPRRMSRQELCDAGGYSVSSGGVTEALADLRKTDAIEGGARDGMMASPLLFD